MDTSDTVAPEMVPPAHRDGNSGGRHKPERRFYMGVALALFMMVLVGFWPSYFSLIFGEPVARPLIMHVHGVIFTGWMLLLLLQVGLVAMGRVDLHRNVGTFGIAYGIAVLLLGVAVSFIAPALHVQSGNWSLDQAAGFLIFPLGDMILFAGFFGAAVVRRSQREAHKRLMLAATIALAFAAVARMEIQAPWLFFFVWVSPLLAGMAFDLYRRRHVHRVYLISFAVFLVFFLRLFMVESEIWLRIGRPMLSPFL
ncbi:hypothetical protein [Pseudohongiella spirulinae]|uniref:Uncharacterized protein n=1 Tax=Pseudohongiella spirulinae TaxID=1249552 RepID=A0A0S2KCE9_9GAMM|nr:hypothetical protein [Pseudohongiella spirulinae]ALO45647.1 hypothetical protein PS2015_978 [Pseudohongiella spirulinae]